MQNFEFQYPYAIIILILPYLVFRFFKIRGSEASQLPVLLNPNISQFTRAFGNKGTFKNLRGQFNYFLFLVLFLLTIALMHPQQVNKISKSKIKAFDIMMAVDLSKSMQALDFATKSELVNRLDVVKSIAKDFIIERQGDRLGLILFGESAYLQSPLTLDLVSVSTMLESSEVGIAGDATALGDAIALAVKTLKDKAKKSRILILMTDGKNTSGRINPIEAAKLAKDFGVKIYAIGVGKKGAVPYPTDKGQVIFAKISSDDKTLKKIANITSGKFFAAEDKQTLESIYNQINLNEQSEEEVQDIIIRKQLFKFPLTLALILLLYRIFVSYNYSKLEAN